MKLKKTLISLYVVIFCSFTFNANATNFFVKVDAPSNNNGLSWESAFNIADFITAIGTSVLDGDAVFFAGGVYYPSKTTGIKMQNIALTLKGGYPTNLSGTDTPELAYPTATPTVLNGDNNNDGVPNTGDVRNAIYVQTTDKPLMATKRDILIQGFTLKGCYYSGTNAYEAGAICADCTQSVTLRNCTFTGNECVNGGGAAFSNSGSKSYLKDCIIENNKTGDAGAAVRSTKRGSAAAYFTASVTIERSLLADNELTKVPAAGASVSGGSAIRLSSGDMWILNSTIANNKGYNKAAIDMDSGTNLYVGSSTIANNQNANTSAPLGSAIHATTLATIKILNSILVGVKGSTEPVVYFEGLPTKSSSQFVSSGANIVGACTFVGGDGFVDDQQSIWDTQYDDQKASNTYENLFGNNTLADNGGFSKTLVLTSPKSLFEVSWIEGFFTQEYNCPFEVDESVDQRNVIRSANTIVGAYDSAITPNSTQDVVNESNLTLIYYGNSIYSIKGATSVINVLDINGRFIKIEKENIVDMSNLPKGFYLLSTKGKTFKIIH